MSLTGLKKWVKVEVALAAACMLTPLLLWIFYRDPNTGRRVLKDSISDYYDIDAGAAFYIPLTVAAMLFVVNGVIKKAHHYNWILGAMLLGVLAFNHDDFDLLHMLFAGSFFLGNALVIWILAAPELLPRRWWRYFRTGILAVIGVAVFLWWPLDVYSLFWAEALSLLAIGFHFILDASDVKYEAAPRGTWRTNSKSFIPRAERPTAGSADLYRRGDGKWAFRVRAANGQIVATDGGQGYENKADARETLEKVMTGTYQGPIDEIP